MHHYLIRDIVLFGMSDTEKIRILLVDGDPGDRATVDRLIRDIGDRRLSVHCAATLQEGCSNARQAQFDVVLCACRIDKETGIDFIRNLRSSDPDTPVILLAEAGDMNGDHEGLQAGAAGFLSRDNLTKTLLDRAIRYAIANAARQRLRAAQEYERARQQLAHVSQQDDLTGVPNRTKFYKRLDEEITLAKYHRVPLILSIFELSNIKEINDVHGYGVGDRLLIDTVERLKASLREDDYLARLDGNEFATIHRARLEPGAIPQVSRRIADAIEAPFRIEDQLISAGIKMGIAAFAAHGESRQDLLANADAALYRAKHSPDQVICVYDHSMDIALRERRAIASELTEAIAKGEMEIHFQPQISVTGREMLGFEALARWRNPERGPIAPSTFIPIAEKSGAIIQLGEWALKTACGIAAGWRGEYKIAVNVSPVQIAHSDLPEIVRQALMESGLAPSRLELEVTEATLIADLEAALRVMHELKKIGVSIAMDDFGTGYSSLSALHRFPVDLIKIDRSFIEQVHIHEPAAQIVRSILGLGRNLSIPVLAEGVEHEDHVKFLMSEDCDEMQGYFIGRPASARNTADLIAQVSTCGGTLPGWAA